MMRKSIHTSDYARFLELLTETRRAAGLTQTQLSERLPFEQSSISKIERGERRIDIIELRLLCKELGVSLTDFARQLDERLSTSNE